MNKDYKLIAEKRNELIILMDRNLSWALLGEEARAKYKGLKSELTQLESEPDIDLAEMSFLEQFDKELNPRLNAFNLLANYYKVTVDDIETAIRNYIQGKQEPSPTTDYIEKQSEPDIDLAEMMTDEEIESCVQKFFTTSCGSLSPLVQTGMIVGMKYYRDKIKSKL